MRIIVLLAAAVFAGPLFAATYEVSDVSDLREKLELGRDAANRPLVVNVSGGSYELSNQLNIYPDTTLTLADDAVISVAPSYLAKYMMVMRHTDDMDSLCPMTGCPHSQYDQFANISVSGGIWDANGSSAQTAAFRFVHGSGLSISNLTCRNCSRNPVEVAAVRDSCIEGVTVESSVGVNLYAGDGIANSNLLVRGCRFLNLDGNALSVNNGFDITLEDNVFSNSVKSAVYANGVSNLSVLGNTVSNPGEYGLRVYQSTGAVVDGNTVVSAVKHGIFVSGESGSPADGLQVTRNKSSATGDGMFDIRIGNYCTGTVDGNCCMNKGFSNASAPDVTYAPGAPAITSVAVVSDKVRVRWELVASATDCEIQRSVGGSFDGVDTYVFPGTVTECLLPKFDTSSEKVRIRARHKFYGDWYTSGWRYAGGVQELSDGSATSNYVVSDIDMLRSALDRAVISPSSYTKAFPLVVKVTSGTYLLDSHIPLVSHTHLILASDSLMRATAAFPGSGMVIARHLSAPRTFCPNDDACTHRGYSQFDDVMVDGGIWEQYDAPSKMTIVARMVHGQNIVLKNMVCRYCNNHTINVSSSRNVYIEGVKIEENRVGSESSDPDDYQGREAIHCDAAFPECEANGYPFDGTLCSNVVVKSCVFKNVFAGVGCHHLYTDSAGKEVHSTKYTIKDCTFENMPGWAIWSWCMDDVEVSGCTMTACRFANVMHSNGFTAIGNSSSGYGITAFGSKNLTFSDNRISNAKETPVYLSDVDGFTVCGNNLNRSDEYGIRIYKSSNGSVVSNTVTKAKKHGIFVSGESGARAASVTVRSNSAQALDDGSFDIRFGTYCRRDVADDNLCLNKGFSNGSIDDVKYTPGAPVFSSVEMTGTDKITAKWGKLASVTTAEFEYSLSEDFSGAKSVAITPETTECSFTLKGCDKGCYVRIRVTHKYYGVSYVSNWRVGSYVPTYIVRFETEGGTRLLDDVRCELSRVYSLPVIPDPTGARRELVGWKGSNGKRYDSGMAYFELAGKDQVVKMVPIWK